MGHELKPQGGFALASAIFLLVVLGGLAVGLLAFGSGQHTALAQDVQGSQAAAAARSGLEWALYQLVKGGSHDCSGFDEASPRNLLGGTDLGDVLTPYTVTVRCRLISSETEGGESLRLYRFWATACNAPNGGVCPGVAGAGYIERQASGGACWNVSAASLC